MAMFNNQMVIVKKRQAFEDIWSLQLVVCPIVGTCSLQNLTAKHNQTMPGDSTKAGYMHHELRIAGIWLQQFLNPHVAGPTARDTIAKGGPQRNLRLGFACFGPPRKWRNHCIQISYDSL